MIALVLVAVMGLASCYQHDSSDMSGTKWVAHQESGFPAPTVYNDGEKWKGDVYVMEFADSAMTATKYTYSGTNTSKPTGSEVPGSGVTMSYSVATVNWPVITGTIRTSATNTGYFTFTANFTAKTLTIGAPGAWEEGDPVVGIDFASGKPVTTSNPMSTQTVPTTLTLDGQEIPNGYNF